ncbi:MAG: 4-hydroxythreonine-4-phosphate dehydrogenase PdxA, partial [Hyphomicrobiales bacterium]
MTDQVSGMAPVATAPLVVTMGDPAGIGPDITLQAWANRAAQQLPPFVVIGAPGVYRDRARKLGLTVPVGEVDGVARGAAAFSQRLPVLPVDCGPVRCGHPTAGNAGAVIQAIERAVALCLAGEAGGMVTGPIAKAVLKQAGFAHPGHTEFLSHLVAGDGPRPLPV